MNKKLMLIGSVCLLVAVSLVFIPALSRVDNSLINDKINGLNSRYQDKLFHSYYSLNELRSFAIIQLDKTSEIYENKWISPESLVDMLSKSEKKQLNGHIVNYLSSIERIESNEILSALESWCRADRIVSGIQSEYQISSKQMHSVLGLINSTAFVYSNYLEENSATNINHNLLSSLEKDEAYHRSINAMARLSKTKQLEYFSEFFKLLAQN